METGKLSARVRRFVQGVRKNRGVAAGMLILAVVVGAAVFAPYVAPHDPFKQNLSIVLQPPFWVDGGSVEYPLGTDYIGRDILSRVIYGGRVSLVVGAGGVAVASLLGLTFGLLAGYFGGWLDATIMRVVEIILAVPYILFVVVVSSMVGSSLVNVILIFGVTDFPTFTRTVRGSVLSVRESQFVESAVAIGARPDRVVRCHILPNIMGAVITIATFEMAAMVLWEASLGFLGLSVPPIIPSWGNMMADGRSYLQTAWWLAVFPGLAVVSLALGMNLVGDWVRFRLDPRSRGLE